MTSRSMILLFIRVYSVAWQLFFGTVVQAASLRSSASGKATATHLKKNKLRLLDEDGMEVMLPCEEALNSFRLSDGNNYTVVEPACLEELHQCAQWSFSLFDNITCGFAEVESTSSWSDCETASSETSTELDQILTMSSTDFDYGAVTEVFANVVAFDDQIVSWGISFGCDGFVYLLAANNNDFVNPMSPTEYQVLAYEDIETFHYNNGGGFLNGTLMVFGSSGSSLAANSSCPSGGSSFSSLYGQCYLHLGGFFVPEQLPPCDEALEAFRESNGENHTEVDLSCLQDWACPDETITLSEDITCGFFAARNSSTWGKTAGECETNTTTYTEDLGELVRIPASAFDEDTQAVFANITVFDYGKVITWGIAAGCDGYVYLLAYTEADYDDVPGRYRVIAYESKDSFYESSGTIKGAFGEGAGISGIEAVRPNPNSTEPPPVACAYGWSYNELLETSCSLSLHRAGPPVEESPSGDESVSALESVSSQDP